MAAKTSSVLALSIVAILLSVVALGVNFAIPGPAGPEGPTGPQGLTGKGLTPTTQNLTVEIIDHGVVTDVNGTPTEIGEYHLFNPSTLIVKKGDTVHVTVINKDEHAHSFVLSAYSVDTGRIPGEMEQPDQSLRTVTVTFTASIAGTFKFECGTPFDEATGTCAPDHPDMVGMLIVLGV